PSSFESLGMNADLGGVLLFQQIKGDVSYQRQVVGSITGAHATLVFTKGHVQDPMQAVFDVPMTPYGLQTQIGIAGQTGNVVSVLLGGFLPDTSFAAYQDQAPEARPGLVPLDVGQ